MWGTKEVSDSGVRMRRAIQWCDCGGRMRGTNEKAISGYDRLCV